MREPLLAPLSSPVFCLRLSSPSISPSNIAPLTSLAFPPSISALSSHLYPLVSSRLVADGSATGPWQVQPLAPAAVRAPPAAAPPPSPPGRSGAAARPAYTSGGGGHSRVAVSQQTGRKRTHNRKARPYRATVACMSTWFCRSGATCSAICARSFIYLRGFRCEMLNV